MNLTFDGRTVLYHPLTPFFVLFCNVVATSDTADFHTLKRMTEELEGLVHLSSSIAKLQMLFSSFIELCEELVSEKRLKTHAIDCGTDIERPRSHGALFASLQPQVQIAKDIAPVTMNDPFALSQPNSAPFVAPEEDFIFMTDGTPGVMDPGWGLFDVQPTLDWLDADLSFFDSKQ